MKMQAQMLQFQEMLKKQNERPTIRIHTPPQEEETVEEEEENEEGYGEEWPEGEYGEEDYGEEWNEDDQADWNNQQGGGEPQANEGENPAASAAPGGKTATPAAPEGQTAAVAPGGKPVAYKEAEECKINGFPNSLTVRGWKIGTEKKVASASGRPKLAFVCVEKSEKNGKHRGFRRRRNIRQPQCKICHRIIRKSPRIIQGRNRTRRRSRN